MWFRLLAVGMLLVARVNAGDLELELDGWTATIDPATLAVSASIEGEAEKISIAAGSAPREIAELSPSAGGVSWKIPANKVTVEFFARGARLIARFTAESDAQIDWPVTGDPAFAALILPEGAGLYVPTDDAVWRARLNDYCADVSGSLHMPFWSFRVGKRTLTYFVSPELRSELCLKDRGGRIGADLIQKFQARDRKRSREIDIGFGDGSPIAPALEYRERLNAAGKFPTLTQKIAAHADVAKLAGAIHMYTWGDGRKPDFIADLVKLGVKRAWIGYDQDPGGEQKTLAGRDFVGAAKAAGYLVGPYDTWNNAQDPKTGDFVSRWPGKIFPDGCIVNRDGKRRTGFAGRGCELSSEAMRQIEPAQKPIANRLDTMLGDGANSYFLDVDAFGELHDDWSPAHPMTIFEDQTNRLARMKFARDRGTVLGSEEGVAWSLALVDFVHGAGGTRNAAVWSEPKGSFGKWWPPDRPGFFFMPMEPSESYRASRYDPAYRVPLYSAAFHDAVVATERWDAPMNKFPSIASTRQLLELLYGTPSIWAMDRKVLVDWHEPFSALHRFFEPLHARIATRRLTAFDWLTPDRRVQRTRFEDVMEITANFGDSKYEDVAPGCLKARWLSENRAETFCPVPPGPATRRWVPGASGRQ